VFPVPAAALRVLYGEMAQIVTTGQRVIPAALQHTGYQFAYPQLAPALSDLLG
jgi:NAD dependent epimerase/dehydratase family enzyme